jgi:hypothetical protein
MDEEEATRVLRDELSRYRVWTYTALQRLIGSPEAYEVIGPSGAVYQIEIEAMWDARIGRNLRVLGSIDDGGGWRAFMPLCEDFIVAPDGTIVGE